MLAIFPILTLDIYSRQKILSPDRDMIFTTLFIIVKKQECPPTMKEKIVKESHSRTPLSVKETKHNVTNDMNCKDFLLNQKVEQILEMENLGK